MHELVGAVSGVNCGAAVVILVGICRGVERRDVRPLAYCGSGATASLAAASLALSAGTWSRAGAVLALLIAAQAASLALALPRPLAHYAQELDLAGVPSWWPAFERQFRVYARRWR